jgi:hypothetical protein
MYGYGYQYSRILGKGGGGGGGFDADYQAVLTYATAQGYTLPSGGQQTLQNDLVVALKAAGVWSKLDTFANFATDGSSDFALIDWKRLSDYTAINSPTFTANVGFQGDGVSAYIDSNYNPAVDNVNYFLDSASFGYDQVISRTTSNTIENNWGTGETTGSFLRPNRRTYLNSSTNYLNATGFNFNTLQLVSVNRFDSTTINLYQNGSLFISNNLLPSTSIGNLTTMSAFKNYAGVFNDSGLSMVYAGADLTAEMSDLYNAWNTYKTSL